MEHRIGGGVIAAIGLLVVGGLRVLPRLADDVGRAVLRNTDNIIGGMGRQLDDVGRRVGHGVGNSIGNLDEALRRFGTSGTENTIENTGHYAAREGTRSSSRVVAIAPRDEAAFKRIFGKGYTGSTKRQMDDFFKRVSSPGNRVSIFSDNSKTIADLESILSEMPNNTLVVTGHSVSDGGARFLILPNGERISENALRELAAKNGKSCILVTCQSTDLGLARNISFDDAGKLIERLGKANVKDSKEEITRYLQAEYKRLRLKSRINVTVVGVGTVAGVTYALGDDD